MRKNEYSVWFILAAEGVALLNDSLFCVLQQRAAEMYLSNLVLAYQLIPIGAIGVLLALSLCLGKKSNFTGLFTGLSLLNIGLLALNHFVFIFWRYNGISLMFGFSVTGAVAGHCIHDR